MVDFEPSEFIWVLINESFDEGRNLSALCVSFKYALLRDS